MSARGPSPREMNNAYGCLVGGDGLGGARRVAEDVPRKMAKRSVSQARTKSLTTYKRRRPGG